jgi:hypothetical protein
MAEDEPPSHSCSNSSRFFIGKNGRGNWVAQEEQGLCGGLFVTRTEAVKFALFENGHRPQAVITVPGILELEISRKPRVAECTSSETRALLARAV